MLINNAGVAYKKALLDMTDEECERTLRVNTLAPMHTIRGERGVRACVRVCASIGLTMCGTAVLPYMQKRKGGHLVVVSSVMDSLAVRLPLVRRGCAINGRRRLRRRRI